MRWAHRLRGHYVPTHTNPHYLQMCSLLPITPSPPTIPPTAISTPPTPFAVRPAGAPTTVASAPRPNKNVTPPVTASPAPPTSIQSHVFSEGAGGPGASGGFGVGG